MERREFHFNRRAIQRMFDRQISTDDVIAALRAGEVIANYPEDKPIPSVLVLGAAGGKPLHVVASRDEKTQACAIITVYIPAAANWGPDFKRRTKS